MSQAYYSKVFKLVLKCDRKYKYYTSAYFTAKPRVLAECYNNLSQSKIDAYNECMAICKNREGYGQKIIFYNHHNFTFAFLTKENTGIVLNVLTTKNYYIINV